MHTVSEITTARASKHARNAREYPDPAGRGNRLNAAAIAGKFRVNWSTIYRTIVGGLEMLPMHVNKRTRLPDPRSANTEETWLESDIANALEAARTVPAITGKFEFDGVAVVTFERAMKELKLTYSALKKLSRRFPFWEPDTLAFRWAKSPETGLQVLVCSAEKVAAAKHKLAEAKTGRIKLPDGCVFLSKTRTEKELRDGRQKVPWQRIRHWFKVGCRHLGGGKLRMKWMLSKQDPWCLEEDVLKIKRAIDQEKLAPPVRPQPQPKPARTWLSGKDLVIGEGENQRFPLAAAASVCHVPFTTFCEWVRKGLPEGLGESEFPGRKVPIKHIEADGYRRRLLPTIGKADVDKLRLAVARGKVAERAATNNGHAANSAAAPTEAPKRKGGRRKSDDVRKALLFCHQHYRLEGLDAGAVRLLGNREWGYERFTSDEQVRVYASRFEKLQDEEKPKKTGKK